MSLFLEIPKIAHNRQGRKTSESTLYCLDFKDHNGLTGVIFGFLVCLFGFVRQGFSV